MLQGKFFELYFFHKKHVHLPKGMVATRTRLLHNELRTWQAYLQRSRHVAGLLLLIQNRQ